MRLRSRREEGQVYPALLLAVIGGFAIAVTFIPLQNLLDQTGRADTAADSAALAAAKSHRDVWKRVPFEGGTPSTRLILWIEKLRASGSMASLEAEKLASANGADVVNFRPDTYRFDFVKKRAAYEVTTMQKDTVEGGDASVRSQSRAVAEATVTNGHVLCGTNADPGVMLLGFCYQISVWPELCIETPNNPNLTTFCVAKFPELEWDIRLVKD